MDWAQYALQVATHAWGEPNGTRRGDEVFWGTQSARKINTQTGTWFDHETAQGGGIADLIRTFAPLANPAEWLRDNCNARIDEPARVNGARAAKHVLARREYAYKHADGTLNLTVTRIDFSDGTKTFAQRSSSGAKPRDDHDYESTPYLLDKFGAAEKKRIIFIAEGEKACDALAQIGLLSSCNPGGAGNWQAHLARHFAERDVVVLPDNDAAGQRHAEQVVASLLPQCKSVRCVTLPNLPHKGDAHDWCRAGGTAAELMQLAKASSALTMSEAADIKTPLRALTLGDLLEREPAAWLLEGIIEEQSLSCIWGDPGSYKTFLALDMALHIAHGKEWYGSGVTKGLVVYVAGEGVAGLRKRVAAWHQHHERTVSDAEFILIEEPAMLNAAGEQQLLQTVEALRADRRVRLVVFDTLARCNAGDENTPEGMGEIIRTLDGLRGHWPGSSTLLIHHQGKDAGKNLRGHSSLYGALDTSLRVRKHENRCQLIHHKQKDAEELPDAWFQMQPVAFQLHALDDPEHSLVPVREEPGLGAGAKKRTLSVQAQTIFRVLQDTLPEFGREDAAGVPGLTLSEHDWREASAHVLQDLLPNSQARAWRRAVGSIEDAGYIRRDRGRVGCV